MSYNLYLDDFREPKHSADYMLIPEATLYRTQNWEVVRSFPEFVAHIERHGIPQMVSFDHDLASGHYEAHMQQGIIDYDDLEAFEKAYEKTGYHCAQWLIEYCSTNQLPLPDIILCHSMNPVGKQNIISLFKSLQ
jgi:hypothetical protein